MRVLQLSVWPAVYVCSGAPPAAVARARRIPGIDHHPIQVDAQCWYTCAQPQLYRDRNRTRRKRMVVPQPYSCRNARLLFATSDVFLLRGMRLQYYITTYFLTVHNIIIEQKKLRTARNRSTVRQVSSRCFGCFCDCSKPTRASHGTLLLLCVWF